MSNSELQSDVLILGDHPAAYLAAALLRQKGSLRIVHATIPEEITPDRIVLINPAFFSLHKLLEPVRRKLDLTSIYGVTFLADDPETRSGYRGKAAIVHTAVYSQVRDALKAIAQTHEVKFLHPRKLRVLRIDEQGLEVSIGKSTHHTGSLILAGRLPSDQRKLLGIPDQWDDDALRRYSCLMLKASKWMESSNRPIIPMSLDIGGTLSWGWMLPHGEAIQLAVESSADRPLEASLDLLAGWIRTLQAHGALASGNIPLGATKHFIAPMGGALSHEGVANRTLLIGPAGGFYSASGEDIYPNCWSAVHAADVLRKALREPHLQDALQPYRHKWRTTLGEYLRGPQQNLRFLLPLVYRNEVMTQRLAESILLGKGVVR